MSETELQDTAKTPEEETVETAEMEETVETVSRTA